MCGIVGAVAQRNITPILIEGLKRLEYRGYDSCGVALHVDGQLQRSRSTSRVADLEKQIAEVGMQGFTGIAHTRWATHGAQASHNAHPPFSPTTEQARIALVRAAHEFALPGTDARPGRVKAMEEAEAYLTACIAVAKAVQD